MRKQLGQMLIEAGAIDEHQLRSALADQRRWGRPLGRTLVELRLIKEEDLVRVLGQQLGLPSVDLDRVTIAKHVIELVPNQLAFQHNIVPFAQPMKFLDVAMLDPTNLGVVDELRIRTQLNIRPHLAGIHMVERAVARHYGAAAAASPSFGGERPGPSRGKRATQAPDSIPLELTAIEEAPIDPIGARTDPRMPVPPRVTTRDREIEALQARISKLEALVERDEGVLRKLLVLLIDKGIATREEIVERLG